MSRVRFVQDVYASFCRGDVPAVLGAFAADIDWRLAESHPYQPSGIPWVGPDAVLQNLFLRIGSDWDGFTVQPRRFHDAGETIVVEGRYTGRHKPSGKPLDIQFCHLWRIRDGKVAGFQQYTDTARLQEIMNAR